MGYHELPSWTHYWCGAPDLSVPYVSNALSRNRFAQILSNIHVNDNDAVPNGNTDKLYKIRPLNQDLIADVRHVKYICAATRRKIVIINSMVFSAKLLLVYM